MEEIKIMILRLVKISKDGKSRTLLQYATPDVDSNNYKGFMLLDQWFDNHVVYNAIDTKYIGVPLKAQFVYERTFKGQAKMVLKTISEENGNCLLAID